MELPTDLIDLKLYLDAPTREAVALLYARMGWELEPMIDTAFDVTLPPLDVWLWRFADVCALYFRTEHDDQLPEILPHLRRPVHLIVRSAISDYMEDEFA